MKTSASLTPKHPIPSNNPQKMLPSNRQTDKLETQGTKQSWYKNRGKKLFQILDSSWKYKFVSQLFFLFICDAIEAYIQVCFAFNCFMMMVVLIETFKDFPIEWGYCLLKRWEIARTKGCRSIDSVQIALHMGWLRFILTYFLELILWFLQKHLLKLFYKNHCDNSKILNAYQFQELFKWKLHLYRLSTRK